MAFIAIHRAATYGDVDALRRELASGVSPDQVGPHGLVPLHFSAAHGASAVCGEDNQLACVRLLIDAGANVSAADDSNMSAILYAAMDGCSALVTALLDAGADANHRDRTNWTPLHHATYHADSAECVRLLINAGAALDARSEAGRTPLELCIMACQEELQRGDAAGSERRRRLYPVLLRAGAPLPAEIDDADSESLDRHAESDAYIRKLRAAGSFQNYERAHLDAIAATFAAKLPLPPELVRRVVEYAFHVGDY